MSEHTKEQIVEMCILTALYHHQGGSSDIGQPIRKILGMGVHEHLSPEQVQKASRAPACVNALQGVPTDRLEEAVRIGITDVSMGNLFSARLAIQKQRDELLESNKLLMTSHNQRCDELAAMTKQRDELLAVLKEADQDFEREGFGEDSPYREPIIAAIASVKGGHTRPKFDQVEFDAMVEKGTKAWAGVDTSDVKGGAE